MEKDEQKVLQEFSTALTTLNLTLGHIDSRLQKVETDVSKSKSHDWKLYLTVFGMITGGLTWAWSQMSASQSQLASTLSSSQTQLAAALRTEMDQKFVPVNQSIMFAQNDRKLILSKLLEESQDRKDDFSLINNQLDRRRDWMESVTETMARFDERSKAQVEIMESVTETMARNEQGLYMKMIDERFGDMEQRRE